MLVNKILFTLKTVRLDVKIDMVWDKTKIFKIQFKIPLCFMNFHEAY